MKKKFELTSETITTLYGRKLFRIKALKDFGDVKKGDLGGFAEKEENIDQSGDADVSGDAEVSGDCDYATVKGFGRYCRNTTFYRGKDKKIHVVCGCFRGDLEAFRKQVKETHGDNKYAREYLMIADLMEMHFKEGDNGK